ncbi:MAG TPA: serine/threonine-protein kinase, partial [Ktedonobacterales bacterium]
MNLASGTTLAGRYRVMRRLGEGGMGGVYLVEDIHQGERWAMKEALADTTASAEDIEWAREHFDQEVALMKRLKGVAAQAGIPTYHDDFSEQGRRYLVMDYIPGDTLEARIDATRAPLPERDVVRWMVDVCRAMETLHGQRPPIILRDLKPGNIMLTPAGAARVIDFGIARTYKAGQISNTENLGTLAYASPEHHGHGQTDARSDIYSLGATMCHALTGREPQPLEAPASGALLHWNHALTPQTEAIVVRAMQLDPAKRFQSAREMAAALEERAAALTPRPRRAAAPATATAGARAPTGARQP